VLIIGHSVIKVARSLFPGTAASSNNVTLPAMTWTVAGHSDINTRTA